MVRSTTKCVQMSLDRAVGIVQQSPIAGNQNYRGLVKGTDVTRRRAVGRRVHSESGNAESVLRVVHG